MIKKSNNLTVSYTLKSLEIRKIKLRRYMDNFYKIFSKVESNIFFLNPTDFNMQW